MVLVFSLQLCQPCLPHTTSRRWTRTSLRESSHPPSLSNLALTDLLGVSIAASPRSHRDLTFLGWPPSAVSLSDVCGLFMEYESSITASQFSLSSFQTLRSAELNEPTLHFLFLQMKPYFYFFVLFSYFCLCSYSLSCWY